MSHITWTGNLQSNNGSLMAKLKQHRRGMLIDKMNIIPSDNKCPKKRDTKLLIKKIEVQEPKKAWVYNPYVSDKPKYISRISKIKSENDLVVNLFNPEDFDSPLVLQIKKTNIPVNNIIENKQIQEPEPEPEPQPKEISNELLDANNGDLKTNSPSYRLYDEYGDRIMLNMIKDDIICKISSFLDNHYEISKMARARMIDWFIEIVWTFNWHSNTFYLASKILDTYFHRTKNPIKIHELHLLGITAFFIASKMEDLVPFSLDKLYNKIAYQKLSKKVILSKEQEMYKTLDYNVNIATMQNFTDIFLVSFYGGTDHQHYELSVQLIDFISKTAHHDYSLIQTRQNVLSASVIYVSFVILEKLVNKKWITKEFMIKLTSFMKVKENLILNTAKTLLVLVQNFDTKHRGLNNMKRVQFRVLSKHM